MFLMTGIYAKRAGKGINWQENQILYFQGKEYQRESQEYIHLLYDAYQTMFEHNPIAKQALLATGDEKLTHSIGWHNAKETILTEKEFCTILTTLRAEFRAEEFLIF